MPFDSIENVYSEKKPPGILKTIWQIFHTDILSITGFYGVLCLVLLCIFGHLIAPYSADLVFENQILLPPSWSHNGSVSFFLGTDDRGRDILSCLLSGAAMTFGSALLVTCTAALLSLLTGALGGMSRGFTAFIMKHIFDTLFALPSLLIAFLIVALSAPSLFNATLAVFLAILPRMTRTVYHLIRDELDKEYVIAVRLDGASKLYILFSIILPNISATLVMELTRSLSMAILDISALGFLNLGAPFSSSEWGAMLGSSIHLLRVAPWAVFLPGILISISILLVNIVGDGLYRAINKSVH
ncbi:putrescine export ABC transporter permease SapC [Candidatus Williamhamiltonella defendens]|uniref:Peptide ABC transporter permease n=1 Tax=Candidatus Hamiltonella defensa (Bemisia tabaci) TaxID=672795 RepID=A0A249DWT5_9ENTR|nr:putrescine export ABC transporter permease SapC [Candidatus Hamiltonella defensa]ASX25829.1 peptide ABC transporter permease [Candidatus Hamiltonella defensa (Bemisia tabaci)]CED78612.1 Peptide transport system permease protein SapC [Candidatus Hamiltonella defensa (Bemisia tabaci)]